MYVLGWLVVALVTLDGDPAEVMLGSRLYGSVQVLYKQVFPNSGPTPK